MPDKLNLEACSCAHPGQDQFVGMFEHLYDIRKCWICQEKYVDKPKPCPNCGLPHYAQPCVSEKKLVHNIAS